MAPSNARPWTVKVAALAWDAMVGSTVVCPVRRLFGMTCGCPFDRALMDDVPCTGGLEHSLKAKHLPAHALPRHREGLVGGELVAIGAGLGVRTSPHNALLAALASGRVDVPESLNTEAKVRSSRGVALAMELFVRNFVLSRQHTLRAILGMLADPTRSRLSFCSAGFAATGTANKQCDGSTWHPANDGGLVFGGADA